MYIFYYPFMPKETRAKFGDKITVRIKRGKKAAAAKKPKDDRRYGPPPIGDDLEREGRLLVTLHDMSQLFKQAKYRERSSSLTLEGAAYIANVDIGAPDVFRWTEMFYHSQRAGFINEQIDWSNVISQSLLRGALKLDSQLPMAADDPPDGPILIFDEIDVYNWLGEGDEENYRKNDACWPIPKDAAALGLSLSINNRQAVIGGSGWILKSQKAENRTAETYDLSVMPVPAGTNAWSRGARDYYSKPGAFRPSLRRGSYPVKVQASGHFYESFDTADDVNYKVTAEPLYTAPEVSGRFSIGLKQFRIYVAPQIWKFAYDTPAYDVYEFARTLPPQKWFRYRQHTGEFDIDSNNRDRYGSDTTGESPFTTNTGEYLYRDKLDFLTFPITATNFPHLESSQDQVALLANSQRGFGFIRVLGDTGEAFDPAAAHPVSGNLVVTNTDTQAGRLVGAVKVSDDKKFYIWRKTITAREIVTLYSGKVSPISNSIRAAFLEWFDTMNPIPKEEQHFYLLDFPFPL